MKSKILTIFVMFIMVNVIRSQEIPYFLLDDAEVWHKQKYSESFYYNLSKRPVIQKDYIPLIKRNYDVLRYDVFMDWYNLLNVSAGNPLPDINATNKISLVITSDEANSIEFDYINMQFNSIKVNGVEHSNIKTAFNKLTLNFDTPKTKGETLNVEIDYTFASDPEFGLIFMEKGLPIELSPPPENDTLYSEERILYTMSEPNDARRWMPCNDYPYDKALTSFTIRVPKEYTVVCNGVLEKTETDEVSETFFWKHDFPITTYLMFAGTSKFGYYYEWYKRVTNPNDSIKVEYYAWQKDIDDTTTDGRNFNAKHAFRNTVPMLEFYSSIFGEYPFERYGMTSFPNTWFAGMEHQTITTMNRNKLRVIDRYGRDGDYSNQSVVAHEIAHQWLGNLVTCASWNDIWINEGGAVWSEALWDDYVAGEGFYYYNIFYEMTVYFWYNRRVQLPPIYAPGSTVGEIFNYATTYAKSGIFYHMLSETLGREKFLSIIRELLAHYAYQSIDTKQFIEFLKSKYPDGAPINIDEFFEQWIYKAGYPKFQIEMSSEEIAGTKDFSVDLNFRQIQEGADVPEVFKTPLWIKFFGSEGEVFQDSVYTKDREEIHNFTIPFMPVMYEVDTLKILCQVNPPIISVKEQKLENTESFVYPNPIDAGRDGKISFNNTMNSNVRVEIFDALGQLVRQSYSGNLSAGSYEFELGVYGLSTGNYYVRISNGVKTIYNKFTIIK